MPRQPDPRYLKRLVSRQLRALRTRTGRTQEDVAGAMDWSVSKLIRIENATVGISTSDLKALMLDYEVVNGEAQSLIDAAKASRQEPWYAKYGDAVDSALRLLIAYESVAGSVHQYQSIVIPGLVQTSGYARAVLALFHPADQVEAAVEARMERQRRFFGDEPDDQPELRLVIEEHLLIRTVGGAEVRRGQIEHLLSIASRPKVSISVVPVESAEHVGFGESFALLGIEDDTVIYDERRGEEYLSNRDEKLVERYWSRYEQIEKVAETGDAAIATLQRCLDRTGDR